MPRPTLHALNEGPAGDFTTSLGTIFEDAPWVADAVLPGRPFATLTALHGAMMEAVRSAPQARRHELLRGHPELAGAAARAGAIGEDSTTEQHGLNLTQASEETAEIAHLNAAYGARFGFPFILCVRRHSRASVLAEFRRRVTRTPAEEEAAALDEIGHITRLRLVDRVDGPGAPLVHGQLTTHVLDTARGRPAAGVQILLTDAQGTLLAERITNQEGRTDEKLLSGVPLRIGWYTLEFHLGSLFARFGPAFFDTIPIRFTVTEPEAHYHVPLVVSPGAYATYRGS